MGLSSQMGGREGLEPRGDRGGQGMIAALGTARDDMTATACSRRSFLSNGVGIAVGVSLEPALAASHRSNLTSLTLSEASALLASRAVSAVELTQACLDRIEKLNPALNAFITVMGDQALAVARQRDEELRRGKSL